MTPPSSSEPRGIRPGGPRLGPYGTWVSPIPLRSDPGDEVVLLEPRVDGGDLHWLEGRPAQDGHQVLVT